MFELFQSAAVKFIYELSWNSDRKVAKKAAGKNLNLGPILRICTDFFALGKPNLKSHWNFYSSAICIYYLDYLHKRCTDYIDTSSKSTFRNNVLLKIKWFNATSCWLWTKLYIWDWEKYYHNAALERLWIHWTHFNLK